MSRRQPVERPAEFDGRHALVDDGVLVDEAGRILHRLDCGHCLRSHLSGQVCPVSLDCPRCRAVPGDLCRTERGDVLSATFGSTHPERQVLASRVDERRARTGDDSVPARWPGLPFRPRRY